MVLQVNFFTCELFKDLTPIFLKPFQKVEEGTLVYTLYEATISVTPKLKVSQKRKKIAGQYH